MALDPAIVCLAIAQHRVKWSRKLEDDSKHDVYTALACNLEVCNCLVELEGIVARLEETLRERGIAKLRGDVG